MYIAKQILPLSLTHTHTKTHTKTLTPNMEQQLQHYKPPPNPTKPKTKALLIKAQKISLLILVISLPLLYISFHHIPPSTLFKDTTFWFLMSNSLIITIIVADSGALSSSHDGPSDNPYDAYLKHDNANGPATTNLVSWPTSSEILYKDKCNKNRQIITRSVSDTAVTETRYVKDKPGSSCEVVDKKIVWSAKDVDKSILVSEMPRCELKMEKENDQYAKLSDEELNRRVEEFIRRFNTQIRLQLRNERM